MGTVTRGFSWDSIVMSSYPCTPQLRFFQDTFLDVFPFFRGLRKYLESVVSALNYSLFLKESQKSSTNLSNFISCSFLKHILSWDKTSHTSPKVALFLAFLSLLTSRFIDYCSLSGPCAFKPHLSSWPFFWWCSLISLAQKVDRVLQP